MMETFGRVARTVRTPARSEQKNEPRYDYSSNEQRDINTIVYKAYGLTDLDIGEVETWYARRYPKLAGPSKIRD